MIKYLKSFVVSEQTDNVWISGLICFVDEGKMVLDRGFVILGNVNPDHYAFYTNFRNFIFVNGELHYMYGDKVKKINPKKVHLHIRIGHSPHEIHIENLTYWHLFFTSPNNKLFKNITLQKEKISLITDPPISNKKLKIYDIQNPLFLDKQVYSENCVMFTGLDINKFIKI